MVVCCGHMGAKPHINFTRLILTPEVLLVAQDLFGGISMCVSSLIVTLLYILSQPAMGVCRRWAAS